MDYRYYSGYCANRDSGKLIGYTGAEGYVYIGLYRGKNVTYKLIRRTHLIWWYYYSEWPSSLIDHENRIRTDDRIKNLNLSNAQLNRMNCTRPKNYRKMTS